MARPLLKPDPHNTSIEELKQLSRIGSSETATRCTAIQMLLAGADRELVRDALLATDVSAAVFAQSEPYRAHLADNEGSLVQ